MGLRESSAYPRSGYPSGEEADLARVAQFFDGVAGRGALDDQLHKVFSAKKKYKPGRLHEYLAGFDNLVIVTTNYDDLMEQSFQAKGRTFHKVIYRTDETTFLVWQPGEEEPLECYADDLDLPVGESPILFKMHGSADPEDTDRDSYVITEDDYVEFLSRMTSKIAIPKPFAKPFRKSHFLFLGYGLRDWNLRVILYKIWQSYPRKKYASWAIQHQANELEKRYWQQRSLTIYELTIDRFLKGLGTEGQNLAAPEPSTP